MEFLIRTHEERRRRTDMCRIGTADMRYVQNLYCKYICRYVICVESVLQICDMCTLCRGGSRRRTIEEGGEGGEEERGR